MIINPYRFAAAGGGVTTPLHWWDLDDDNTWADQGTGAWANLTEESAAGAPTTTDVTTTTSTVGTVSRTVCDLGSPTPHRLTGGNHTWDGVGDNISMSVWAYLDNHASTANSYIQWRNAGFPRIAGFNTYTNTSGSDDLNYSQLWDAGNDQVNAFDPATIATGQWYHFAFTWDGTTIRLYTDGTEVATGTNAAVGALSTSSMPFKIGGLTATSNNHDGLLAMAGIWDVALTADEVSTLYAGGDGVNYSEATWT